MNTWFQFKQFTVHQDKTAMKVCTDACLFGAWTALKIVENKIKAHNILDIGCGTGLLSLMLAQKSNAKIDAVEIDRNAFEQAKKNFELSPWKGRFNIFHNSITIFKTPKKYEFIISNPPFYENQLKSGNDERNKAMHATTLSYIDLVTAIKNNLTKDGVAAVLLPFAFVNEFEKNLLANQLFIVEKLNISHSPLHPFFRSFLLIAETKIEFSEDFLAIKNNDNSYSTAFKDLLKAYYLNF